MRSVHNKLTNSVAVFTLAVMAVLLFNTCKENPVDPNANLTPGRRDYVWTVDTLKAPFFIAERIWGSSPNDVWAVGPGGGLDKTLWHYDGKEWKTDGISRSLSPMCIFGFNHKEVWATGYEGDIWKFDGTEWVKNYKFIKNNHNVIFDGIYGNSPNNIFAVGLADSATIKKALIINYNGLTWKEIDIQFYPYSFYSIKKTNNTNFFLKGIGTNPLNERTDALFEFDGKRIKQIYEAVFSKETWAFIQDWGGRMYFLIGNKICRYIDNEFKTVFSINAPNFGGQIYGRSEKDILLRMFDGIAHYNGSDVVYLYKFQNQTSIRDAMIFENAVFFVANDFHNNINLVFKGELK